jgi:hypothetical protein
MGREVQQVVVDAAVGRVHFYFAELVVPLNPASTTCWKVRSSMMGGWMSGTLISWKQRVPAQVSFWVSPQNICPVILQEWNCRFNRRGTISKLFEHLMKRVVN